MAFHAVNRTSAMDSVESVTHETPLLCSVPEFHSLTYAKHSVSLFFVHRDSHKKPITDVRVISGCVVQISYLILPLMPIKRCAVIFLFEERNLQVGLAIFDASTLYASMLVSLDTSF